LQRVELFLGNDRKQSGSRGNSPRATIEVTLETVFSTVVRAERLRGGQLEQEYAHSRVEAGSNTSTVVLRVVGGDKKEKSRIWDGKIWSRVPQDSDPKINALARTSINCK
jgi:hypothetical protein